MHWHPPACAHRERRDFSTVLPPLDAEGTNELGAGTGSGPLLDHILSHTQGGRHLMEQLKSVAAEGRSPDAGDLMHDMVYHLMCEAAADLLMGIQQDLGVSMPAHRHNPVSNINPMLRQRPLPNARPTPNHSHASGAPNPVPPEEVMWCNIDDPPTEYNAWWSNQTVTDEERQVIESCGPSQRCAAMALAEHAQLMHQKAQDIMAHVQNQRYALGEHPMPPGAVDDLPPGLAKFVDQPRINENDYVAFQPCYRVASTAVPGPDEAGTLRFLRCVVRSSYSKLSARSVVFIPCTPSYMFWLRQGSAVTIYACQSKEVENMVLACRYALDKPIMYTAVTRAKKRFVLIMPTDAIWASLDEEAKARISYLYLMLYMDLEDERFGVPDEIVTMARHRQHQHSEQEGAGFAIDGVLSGPGCSEDFRLGAKREEFLRSVPSFTFGTSPAA